MKTNGRISVSGDEHDRDISPLKLQFPLEIRSRHTRHGNVEDQAVSFSDAIGREELLR
jgi:hypothetical protein